MIERAEILNVFRAADQAVVEGTEEDRRRVGAVLRPYDQGAAGWFERFRRNVDRSFGADLRENVDDSLSALIETGRAEEEDPLRSKALLAVAALVRADPAGNLPGPDSGTRVNALRRVLRLVMPGETRNIEDRQIELLNLLASEVQGTELMTSWELILAEAVNRNLVLSEVAAEANQCCQDSTTSVLVEGRLWPAAILTTNFSTTETDVAGLARYFDPTNWPGCCTLWCHMTPLYSGPSSTCYFEEIAYACPDRNSWHMSACLEFVKRDIEGGVALEYELCPHPEHLRQTSQIVTVDEGSITAWQDGPLLRITSTKRVSFRGNFDAPSFAMWSCALGYGEAAEEMVLRCGPDHGRFPDPLRPDVPRSLPPWNDPAEVIANLIEHWAHVAADEVKAATTAAQNAMAKMATGTYTTEDLITDVSQAWARGARCMFPMGGSETARTGAPWTHRSRQFQDPSPDVSTRRAVTLAGPLVNGFGQTIGLGALGVDPPMLQPGERAFAITARITNERSGVYTGEVHIALSGGGATIQTVTTVPVWLQVG